MKKGLKFVLALTTLLVAPITLTSCGETTSEVDENQDIVNAALTNLSVQSTVTEDFTLTVSGIGGATISWTSNNSAITIDGSSATVTRSTEADVTVILTATATKGSASGTRDFTVTVSKLEISNDYISVQEAIASAKGTSVKVKGVVSNYAWKDDSNGGEQYKQGMYITDSTGTIYCYGPKVAQSVNIGDEITFTATTDSYTRGTIEYKQLTSPSDCVTLNSNVSIPLNSAITGKTLREVLDDTEALHKTYIMDIKVVAYQGSGYVNYEIMDSAGTWMLLEGSNSGAEFKSLVSDTLSTMAFSICSTTGKDVYKAVIIDMNVNQ